jgi:hypothetical protein
MFKPLSDTQNSPITNDLHSAAGFSTADRMSLKTHYIAFCPSEWNENLYEGILQARPEQPTFRLSFFSNVSEKLTAVRYYRRQLYITPMNYGNNRRIKDPVSTLSTK